MDNGRQSTASYYDHPRSSFDALNSGRATPPAASRQRMDSSSTYSKLPPGAGLGNSAGYNRDSYYALGREEPVKGGEEDDQGWDVFADFNNQGPRYSTAFVAPSTNGYHQLDKSPTTPRKLEEDDQSTNVEMVTVPALGAEWKASELRGMRASERNAERNEVRARVWRNWWRGEHGFCGGVLTRKTLAFVMFGVIVVAVILLAIMIPRVPGFQFNGQNPLKPAANNQTDPQFQRLPANFSFNALMDIQLDTNANFLPVHISKMDAQVFDASTSQQVASGGFESRTFPAKEFTQILLPLSFNYTSANDSDTTWQNWYNACRNKQFAQPNPRPGVSFQLILRMDIRGLIGTKGASTAINSVGCPFELPLNAA